MEIEPHDANFVQNDHDFIRLSLPNINENRDIYMKKITKNTIISLKISLLILY